MEALTAASVAALTVYDMCKAVDKGLIIGKTCKAVDKGLIIGKTYLVEKTGGTSGQGTTIEDSWIRFSVYRGKNNLLVKV